MKKLICTLVFTLGVCSTQTLAQRSDASLPECNADQGEQICGVLFRKLNKLQKKGSPEAANLLALFYLSGEYGLPKDPEKGVKMLERAARKRSPIAQYELAKLYFTGEHVEQDVEKALMLMGKAAKMKYADAIATYNIIKLEQAKTEEEKAEYLAAISEIELGKLNDADYFLGKYFRHVENQEEAQKYLGMAAKRGHRKAREIVVNEYPQMVSSEPEVYDDEYERITVTGVRPDVNAAAREIIALANSSSTFSGKSTGSKVPGRSCLYDGTCNVLTRENNQNRIYQIFNAVRY